jgi:hypothetical protein
MVATAGQKVEIVMAVIAIQAFRHSLTVKGESRIGARKAKSKSRGVHIWECPPLAKNAKDGPPTNSYEQRVFHSLPQ